MMGRIVLQLIVAGLLMIGGIGLFQDRLLYFPEKVALPALLASAQQDGLRRWPAQGEFRGLMREPTGPARATLILFHGNAGHAGHRAFYARLSRFGVRVILAEYPGYGPRSGTPGEETLAADAAETVALAQRDFAVPVVLTGESLGASVASAAYVRVPQAVAALWLITPWDNLANVARHHYPWLPVDWMLRDRYDSLAHLSSAHIPVAVMVAERDTIVPVRFGQRLYEQLPAPKRLWQVPGADHNDVLYHVDEPTWTEMVAYLLQESPARNDSTPSKMERP